MAKARIRRLLRRSTRLRSAHAFARSALAAARASPARVERGLEAEYAAAPDPWDYAGSPVAQRKYAVALDLLDGAGLDRVASVLEIGCGEGFFTQRLAPRAEHVLAVDMSALALERAAARCASCVNTSFRRWDLLQDAPLGTFDLVVCMDVLQYVPRPAARRAAVAKVAACVAPGGALLLSGVLTPEYVENAAWTRLLAVSARADAGLFERRLTRLDSRATELNLVSLFGTHAA